MKHIGPHVSAGGGVENAPLNAAAAGATAFAFFTKNQRQWQSAPLSERSIAAFKRNCSEKGFAPEHILPHDGYLINLGQPDAEKREQSYRSFVDELSRVRQLGLKYLNFHPGSSLGAIPLSNCIGLIAECCNRAIDEVEDVFLVVENTAGQGSCAGFAFEQIGELFSRIDKVERMRVCVDTCHSFAAGYDLSTEEGYEWTWKEFGRHIGFACLGGIHLNDAKAGPGSRLDRHESIGKGKLGMNFFRRLMKDPRFDDIPIILETPDETLWPEEIKLLHSLEN